MLMKKKWWLSILLTLALPSAVAHAQELPLSTNPEPSVTTPESPVTDSESLTDAPNVAAVLAPATGNISSAGFGISTAQITADLQQRLQNEPPPEQLSAGEIALTKVPELLEFYRRRAYQPSWINDANKPSQLAEQLLDAVNTAEQNGLRPAFYNATELRDVMRSLKIAFAPTPRQLANFDLLLSDTYFTYAAHILAGRLSANQVEQYWKLEPRSMDLVSHLQGALVKRDIAASLDALSSPHPGYASLRNVLSEYREQAEAGGWPRVPEAAKLELGARGEAVKQLQARLQASGDLEALTAVTTPSSEEAGNTIAATEPKSPPQAVFDNTLQEAVMRFQERHGLAADGVVGPNTLAALNVPIEQRIREIELNLERFRWLPASLGERYIEVNIPAYQLKVVENDQNVLTARVIVGRDDRPTPIFTSDMSYLVFSPYWYVPRTIMVEDKLPILRKRPYSLRKQGIRIFSGSREIDPGKVRWSRVNEKNFSYSMRQDPGKHNALGGIKFMFPNQHSVYIHDTSSPNLFKRDKRAFSSGCVRVDSPVELAEYLLQSTDWNRDKIIKASNRKREQRVELPSKIPVHLLYWTAWVDADGTVQFREDIYDRDAQLAQAFFSS